MSKAYPSNLTPAQWELLAPLIPPPKPGGRPRQVEIWEVINAIFYVLCQGCTWRALPGDFPNWQTGPMNLLCGAQPVRCDPNTHPKAHMTAGQF